MSLGTAVVAFAAGFVSVLVFHQGVWALYGAAGKAPGPAWNMAAVPPLGVPMVISSAFWGGVWGIVLAWLLPIAAPSIGILAGGHHTWCTVDEHRSADGRLAAQGSAVRCRLEARGMGVRPQRQRGLGLRHGPAPACVQRQLNLWIFAVPGPKPAAPILDSSEADILAAQDFGSYTDLQETCWTVQPYARS